MAGLESMIMFNGRYFRNSQITLKPNHALNFFWFNESDQFCE